VEKHFASADGENRDCTRCVHVAQSLANNVLVPVTLSENEQVCGRWGECVGQSGLDDRAPNPR
jgi:hypothetical protein